MAIVNPSALISSISGTIGGICFKMTRTGLVAARPRSACNRRTSHQLLAHKYYLRCLGYFRSMSAPRLASWKDAARSYNRRNRLGLSALASPWSLYLEATYYYVAAGGSAHDCPATSIRHTGPTWADCTFWLGGPYYVRPIPPVLSGLQPLLVVHAARTFSPVESRTSPQIIYCPSATWEWPPPIINGLVNFAPDLHARQGVPLEYEMLEVSLRYYGIGFLPSVPILARAPVLTPP